MKKEADIVKEIRTWLNKQDSTFVWKNHGSGMGMKGVSDLIGVHKGMFLGIEVKRPDKIKNVTPLQRYFLNKISSCGGYSLVATSLAEVQEFMAGLRPLPANLNKNGKVK